MSSKRVEWREVPGWHRMFVDRTGRILGPMGLRKLRPAKGGYLFVQVGKKRRRLWVSHAVLLAFVGPQPDGHEARHLNGDRQDNRPENLAWGTRKENMDDQITHGTRPCGEQKPQARLTEEQVREIRADPRSIKELVPIYGVSGTTLRLIRRRKKWAHLP